MVRHSAIDVVTTHIHVHVYTHMHTCYILTCSHDAACVFAVKPNMKTASKDVTTAPGMTCQPQHMLGTTDPFKVTGKRYA